MKRGRHKKGKLNALKRKFGITTILLMLIISAGLASAGWWLVKSMHEETSILNELVDIDSWSHEPEGKLYVLPENGYPGDSVICKWEITLTEQGLLEPDIRVKIEGSYYGIENIKWKINQGEISGPQNWISYTPGEPFTVHVDGTLIEMDGILTAENLIDGKAGIDIEFYRETA